jgi:hypothetical protein
MKVTESKFTIKGKSGATHIFDIYTPDTTFNNVGAVYVFTRRYQGTDSKFTHEIIYCGKTEDLSTRFNNHHKAGEIKKKNANCLCIKVATTENERTKIEEDILMCTDNNFPCNDTLNH